LGTVAGAGRPGTSRRSRVLLAALFFGMVAVAAVLSRRADDAASAPLALPGAAVARYGFRLTEQARAAGLVFTHQAPTFDPRLAHIRPQIASMGAGAAVADFDQDGWADLYVTNSGEGSRNALFRNLGNGHFADVAAAMGVADVNRPGTGVSAGAVWGDYDNDGFDDLLITKWGRPELFHNEAGHAFRRVTEGTGLPAWVNATAATWLDYDRDGKLDLFIGGYYPETLDLWHLTTTRMMPESFEYATNGGRKYLFRNLGGGRFTDMAQAVGLVSTRWALAAAAADLRGTGWPDLVIANDYGVSEYFLNEAGRFREVGAATHVGERPKSGMNVAFGDVFNNGARAIYVTNISEEGNLVQGNNLWVPRAGTPGPVPVYDNLANAMDVEMGGWSFGAQFGDLDNDGFQDLFLTNGYVSQNPQRSYWYNFSKIAGGNRRIIEDAANWPPMEDMSLSGYQRKHVWRNDGVGRFEDVAAAVGVNETFDGRAVALADFGNRGELDVVVANQRGPLLLYRNEVAPGRDWIAFELTGTRSNRAALGARVRVDWHGMTQVQDVLAASGFCAQNQRRLHFGLGADPGPVRVTIHWPSGTEQVVPAPAVNQVNRITEPAPAGPPGGQP
jgi:enediyne biosynthesis protein E4